jgi:hypothetical protein
VRLELGRLRLDHHAVLERRRARRDEAVRIVEADQARSTRAGWLKAVVVTECRHLDTDRAQECQDG